MVTAIIFIIILGVLIFVHELGHFVVARRNGVKADEFGFGFPPRMAGFFKDEKSGKYKFVWGNKDIRSRNTVYSVNWIPLGGFVKIKGENGGEADEEDSFASKKAWPRVKILAAGVIMNFILAWILISAALMIGAPEAVESNDANFPDPKIQITQVVPGSPAEGGGIMVGDEIISLDGSHNFENVSDVQSYIGSREGEGIMMEVKRGRESVSIEVVPVKGETEDKGMIGVGLTQTVIVKYPFLEAVWKGAVSVYDITILILVALGGIIKSIFAGQGVGADISGPIGIAILTKQVATLGLVYILQFAALLSINLGIINALPIPALDGGRILFILVEKIKGSPVSQKTEHMFHTIGFLLLIILMILVTFRDIGKFVK